MVHIGYGKGIFLDYLLTSCCHARHTFEYNSVELNNLVQFQIGSDWVMVKNAKAHSSAGGELQGQTSCDYVINMVLQ
jgi:hypothetical protein